MPGYTVDKPTEMQYRENSQTKHKKVCLTHWISELQHQCINNMSFQGSMRDIISVMLSKT